VWKSIINQALQRQLQKYESSKRDRDTEDDIAASDQGAKRSRTDDAPTFTTPSATFSAFATAPSAPVEGVANPDGTGALAPAPAIASDEPVKRRGGRKKKYHYTDSTVSSLTLSAQCNLYQSIFPSVLRVFLCLPDLLYVSLVCCQDKLILEGVRLYGKKWRKIAEHVGNGIRTDQVRVRWLSVLDPTIIAKKRLAKRMQVSEKRLVFDDFTVSGLVDCFPTDYYETANALYVLKNQKK
jgi:hypothetical protein